MSSIYITILLLPLLSSVLAHDEGWMHVISTLNPRAFYRFSNNDGVGNDEMFVADGDFLNGTWVNGVNVTSAVQGAIFESDNSAAYLSDIGDITYYGLIPITADQAINSEFFSFAIWIKIIGPPTGTGATFYDAAGSTASADFYVFGTSENMDSAGVTHNTTRARVRYGLGFADTTGAADQPLCALNTDDAVPEFTIAAATGVDLRDGDWHFIACVLNSTTNAVFVDGSLINSVVRPNPEYYEFNTQTDASNYTSMVIGYSPLTVDVDYVVDELLIFDYTLSENDVNLLYTVANKAKPNIFVPSYGTFNENDNVDVQFNASGTNLTWNVVSVVPSGVVVSLDDNSGENASISFSVDSDFVAYSASTRDVTVTLKAVDEYSGFEEQSFVFTINNVNREPSASSSLSGDAGSLVEGESISFNIYGIDPDIGEPLTIVPVPAFTGSGRTIADASNASLAIASVTIDTSTNSLTVGSHVFNFSVSDTHSASDIVSVTLTVTEATTTSSTSTSSSTTTTVAADDSGGGDDPSDPDLIAGVPLYGWILIGVGGLLLIIIVVVIVVVMRKRSESNSARESKSGGAASSANVEMNTTESQGTELGKLKVEWIEEGDGEV